MKMRFYRCAVCGKVIAVLSDTGIPTICCGQEMKELVPNKTDGAVEKHVPVFSQINNMVQVQIGSAFHPMTDSHSIHWIGLETGRGFQFEMLHPGDSPEAYFCLCPEEQIKAVYGYCNLHGLWCAGAPLSACQLND